MDGQHGQHGTSRCTFAEKDSKYHTECTELQEWECNLCGTFNRAAGVCKAYEHNRKDNAWVCPSCTLFNLHSRSNCGACGQLRNQSASSESSLSEELSSTEERDMLLATLASLGMDQLSAVLQENDVNDVATLSMLDDQIFDAMEVSREDRHKVRRLILVDKPFLDKTFRESTRILSPKSPTVAHASKDEVKRSTHISRPFAEPQCATGRIVRQVSAEGHVLMNSECCGGNQNLSSEREHCSAQCEEYSPLILNHGDQTEDESLVGGSSRWERFCDDVRPRRRFWSRLIFGAQYTQILD